MKHAIVLVVTALSVASLAAAQPATAPAPPAEALPELLTKAREARLKGDVPTWLHFATRSLALTPDHPDVLISAARVKAASGDTGAALDHLDQAVRRGLGTDPAKFAEFRSLVGNPRFEALAVQARRNLIPVANASEFADLADRRSEGITFDPVSKRFFAGTQQSEIVAIGADGAVSTFASGGGLRQILGMKVDAKRRLLWVVNGRYPEGPAGPDSPPDMGTGGVRAYHLDTGALVTVAEIDERPLLHGFNDIALAADGTVYVTDSNTQAVYVLPPGGKQLELMLRDSHIAFPNGIAIAPDDRRLYVAHAEGISAIDVATKARKLLPLPADGSVHSIDGLLLRDGILYGVQPSPYLQRIVAAALTPAGDAITRVWTVTSRTPGEYGQSTAAFAGDAIYMIGGNPVADMYGGTNPAKPVRKIWRVPLTR